MEVPMPRTTRWFQTIHERLLRLLARTQLATLQRRQAGITSVEYIIVAAVVLVVVFAAIKGFFGAVAHKFDDLTKTVNGS
jgi:Flp pilus assembly pilin Flp